MSALTKRLQRLEGDRRDGPDPVEVMLVSFCERAEDGSLQTRAGFAQFLRWDLPNMTPEEGESDDAFSQRVDAVLADAKANSVSRKGATA